MISSGSRFVTALQALALLVLLGFVGHAQAPGAATTAPPATVDTTRIGPQVGQPAAPFNGVDQFGTPQSLQSTAGPRGVMLVFFRSADW